MTTMERDFSEQSLRSMFRSAKQNNYTDIFFGEEKKQTNPFILWRHDIDLELPAVVRMAKIEAEEGIKSTYFFMTKSYFYNLFNKEAREVITKVLELGHQVGLHCDLEVDRNDQLAEEIINLKVSKEFALIDQEYPGVFRRIVSFHNPPECVLKKTFTEFYSTYDEMFFGDIKYLSDSNRHFREGLPESWFEAGHHSRYSILLHPVIWAYPGRTMSECVRHYLEQRTKRTRATLIADDVWV